MKHRMAIAVLALAGFFVSLYLWLWKVGFLGTIACGDGGCETVQLSEYAEFVGLPVAFHGMVGYLVLMIVSLVGLQPKWIDRREPTVLLVVLSGIGVLFAVYLTYLEAAVIHAWCRWCVVSAVLIMAILAVAVFAWTQYRTSNVQHPTSDT
jgi:uncharacterized membrane protein